MFPRQAVGSVVGFGGMAGAISGMLIAGVTAAILQWHRQLRADLRHRVVRVSGGAVCVHLLSPRLAPAPAFVSGSGDCGLASY